MSQPRMRPVETSTAVIGMNGGVGGKSPGRGELSMDLYRRWLLRHRRAPVCKFASFVEIRRVPAPNPVRRAHCHFLSDRHLIHGWTDPCYRYSVAVPATPGRVAAGTNRWRCVSCNQPKCYFLLGAQRSCSRTGSCTEKECARDIAGSPPCRHLATQW